MGMQRVRINDPSWFNGFRIPHCMRVSMYSSPCSLNLLKPFLSWRHLNPTTALTVPLSSSGHEPVRRW